MHPPNTTCNHLISPAAAADSSIPFAAADQDDDICSSSIITNNCNDGCDLIDFPINSSPNSLYYPEFQNSINYLQFLEDFSQQYQFNYDYPNPSPDPPPPAAAAGYHHHHYQSDEIVPPLPPPPPPPLNMRPLENSDNNICSTNENNNNSNTSNYGKSKRTCKKDRHSKIHTAKGLRDRRMRLSLDVARKFFRLQDLLGFDKASRTVDWLLTNSADAIRDFTATTDLKAGVNSGSCTSDDVLEETPEMPSEKKAAEKKKRGARKGKRTETATAERARVGRESRRKARERARERTSQKRRLNLRCQSNRTSTQQEKLRLGFAESSEKEYSGNDDASWNNSYGYIHCTADAAAAAAWI